MAKASERECIAIPIRLVRSRRRGACCPGIWAGKALANPWFIELDSINRHRRPPNYLTRFNKSTPLGRALVREVKAKGKDGVDSGQGKCPVVVLGEGKTKGFTSAAKASRLEKGGIERKPKVKMGRVRTLVRTVPFVVILLLAAGYSLLAPIARAETAQVVGQSLSLGFMPVTTSSGDSIHFHTWDGSAGLPLGCNSEGTVCVGNGEILKATPGNYDYLADYTVSDAFGPYEAGEVGFSIGATDTDGSGLPDAFDWYSPGGTTSFSGLSYPTHNIYGLFYNSTISGSISRAEGAWAGSYNVTISNPAQTMSASGVFHLTGAAGTASYTRGANSVVLTVESIQEGYVYSGVVPIQRVGLDRIDLMPFTLSGTGGGPSMSGSASTFYRSGYVYRGFLEVADGDPDTPWPDFTLLNVAIVDDADLDGNGLPDLSFDPDADSDGDGVPDGIDVFPFDPTETIDSDSDGTGNNADTDDDNDGVHDSIDDFPLDASENLDTDGDGTGNNADTDDDGDGYTDIEEAAAGSNPLDASSVPSSGAPTLAEFNAAGGYQAYLAESANTDLRLAGICNEASAFAHWRDFGANQGRTFAAGGLRTDNLNGSPDPDYAIDGGFAWEYPGANTVVFITADAPKPAGWAGLPLLLERCQTFNIGSYYSAQAYSDINTDVRNAIDQGWVPSFQSVTDHYVKYGFKEGRLTSSNWTEAQVNAWDDAGYLSANPDVANYFQGAANSGWSLFGKYGFAHWINFGQYEGRSDGQGPTVPVSADPVSGGAQYAADCAFCHGASGDGTASGSPLVGCLNCQSTFEALENKIQATMPPTDPGACVDACAADTAAHILCSFNPGLAEGC